MTRLKKSLEDSWESVKPQRRGTGNGGGNAPKRVSNRDTGNVALSGALVIVFVWIIGMFGIEVPPTIAVAFGTIVGYAVGRLFRY